MQIERIEGMGSVSGGEKANIRPLDTVSKNIENQIVNIQRQIQALSSDADISAEEKRKRRQELMQEISRLNAELRRHQAEVSRQQRKEELQTDAQEKNSRGSQADAQDTGTQAASMGVQDMVTADSAMEQVKSQDKITAKMKGRAAVLKSEIKQDKLRGENVDRKQAELAKQERRVRRAADAQTSVLERKKSVRDRNDGRVRRRGKVNEEDGKVLLKGTNYSLKKSAF